MNELLVIHMLDDMEEKVACGVDNWSASTKKWINVTCEKCKEAERIFS
jgi:hypothetical protein